MAKVAPSLLAVGSAAAFAPQLSSKKGISLYHSRIVRKRARISAKLGTISIIPELFQFCRGCVKQDLSRVMLAGGDGELKPQGKKKFITKEEEPEQYWQTAGERKGENPMMTPLPYIIIFGMSTPFVILAIAFANGWIKVPVR